ncbi:hypothetical protein R9K83_00425 [Escherichia coli]
MFFTARYTPGSQQTECAGAVIHQKWHAAVHTHPGDNMYVAVTNGAIVIHTQRLKSDPGGNLLS